MTLTANSNNLAPGQTITLTAVVTPASTPPSGVEQNPTGNVIFYDGTTMLGTAALSPASGDTSVATLVSATLPGGQVTIIAVYVGDSTFLTATSNALTVNVQDFTVTPSASNPPSGLTIVQGSAGSASFLIAGEGGFNHIVQVVCTTESQDDINCTASPQQVTPTATVTFVVQTYSTGTAPNSARNGRGPLWPGAAGGAALAALGFFLLPFGRRARILASRPARRFCILLLLLIGLGGAGIGCSSFNLISGPGTPLGVATLKITAASDVDNTVVSRSVYLTVNVVPKS